MQKKESSLDPHRNEIIMLLELGVTRLAVAKKFGVHRMTLAYWLNKNNLSKCGKKDSGTAGN